MPQNVKNVYQKKNLLSLVVALYLFYFRSWHAVYYEVAKNSFVTVEGIPYSFFLQ